MNDADLNLVRFCGIECELQGSGERSVAWMVEALIYAQDTQQAGSRYPKINEVLVLGRLVEPFKNADGFRKCGVRVGSDVKMDWKLVPGQMVNLMEAVKDLSPAEFCREYLEIHPWRDGNGRTSAVLYNWLSGTLHDPDWHPNFWNDPRRMPGDGAPRN